MVSVSVNIITKNRLPLLKRAVDSVLAQTLGDVEIVIIDNGDNDAVSQYVQSMRLNNITSYAYPVGRDELYKARNLALSMSEGKYIAVLDDDDVFLNKRKLAEQYSLLQNCPDYGLVGTAMVLKEKQGKVVGCQKYPLSDEAIRGKILCENPFCHSAVMFRKDLAVRLGGYQQVDGKSNINEYLLWLKMGVISKMANIAMVGVCAMVNKPQSLRDRIGLYLDDFQRVCEFKDYYPNFSNAVVRFFITHPFKYVLGGII